MPLLECVFGVLGGETGSAEHIATSNPNFGEESRRHVE
jgi:hypothetical protein